MVDFTRPVQTEKGESVRILSTDGPTDSPIVGMFEDVEAVYCWKPDGTYPGYPALTLRNAPEPPEVYQGYLVEVDGKVYVMPTEERARSFAVLHSSLRGATIGRVAVPVEIREIQE